MPCSRALKGAEWPLEAFGRQYHIHITILRALEKGSLSVTLLRSVTESGEGA